MKYIFHLSLFFVFISACAQDSLFLKDNNVYAVTVTNINLKNVTFRKWNDTDTIYIMPLSMVSFIKYSIDSTPEDTVLPPKLPGVTYEVHSKWHLGMYNKGVYDAEANYSPKARIGGWVFVGSFLLGPVLGLIPAIAVAKSHIPDKRLHYPDKSLIKNDSYYAGYTHEARRKKAFDAWIGYGVAATIEVTVGCLILQGVTR